MALSPCRECGKNISTEALACPSCGAPVNAAEAITLDADAFTTPSEKSTGANPIAGLLGLALLVLAGWYFWGGGLVQEANRELDRIEIEVAEDAVRQYDIVKRHGSAMDRCVQAGLVAAAWLQATDDSKYREWKKLETADCSAAGLPGM